MPQPYERLDETGTKPNTDQRKAIAQAKRDAPTGWVEYDLLADLTCRIVLLDYRGIIIEERRATR